MSVAPESVRPAASWQCPTSAGLVTARMTGRVEGDLAPQALLAGSGPRADALRARRTAVSSRPWSWLHQVHGARVRVVDDRPVEGEEGDALVTRRGDVVLAVHTADCAPVALAGATGVIGAVHAGWRGLEAGVVEATVARMVDLGRGPVSAWVGPCIHPCCYEFDGPGRAQLVARVGPTAEGTTTWGTPAVDLPAAVTAELGRLDVALTERSPGCTACGDRWWSHRARQEPQRLVAAAWLEQP